MDILVLQETFTLLESTKQYFEKCHPDLKMLVKHTGDNRQGGIGFISRKIIKCEFMPSPCNFEDRILKLLVEKNNFKVVLVNIYAPAVQGEGNAIFFKSINPFLISEYPLVLLGDFNFVEVPNIDRSVASQNYIEATEPSRKTFIEIKAARKLIDVYRALKPYETRFTHVNDAWGIHSRIDRIYTSQDHFHMVTDFHISDELISDHRLIGITLQEKPSPKWGYGHKKLNPFYLDNPYFEWKLGEEFQNYQYLKNVNGPLQAWQIFKQNTWVIYNRTTKSVHMNNKFYLEALYKEDPSENVLKEINEILNFPNKLKKATGAEFYKEVAEEDFLPMYLKNKTKFDQAKNIESILNRNNLETSDKDEIIEEIRHFYSNLYSTSNPNETDITEFLDMELPQIGEALKGPLSDFIHVEEVKKAIKTSNKGKTPGPDGIPIEFYIKNIDNIAPILAEMYNNIFLRGSAPEGFNSSITTLLYKGKGERTNLKNWRPVSLLNCDYKILTKILANRISPVLPELIDESQTCGVPGRNSFENLYNISAIIHQIQDQKINPNKNLLLANLDQEKAFDLIEYAYIRNVLRSFGFPEEIIKWYNIINTDASAQICINGLLTDPINITRSVRQGDPLSMILYILGIEPVAIKIKRDKDIKGFKAINSSEVKISRYADDSNPILEDLKSYRLTLEHFRNFCKASGSKLNENKTKILALGNWKNYNLDQIKENLVESIEILGVNFGKDMNLLNWPGLLATCNGILKTWDNQHLTIRTKIYIVNTYVLSNIWHVARVIEISQAQVDALQRMVATFIWGGPKEGICRETAYLPLTQGGIAMPNIKAKIQAMYLQRYCFAREKVDTIPPWVGHLIYYIGYPLRNIHPTFGANRFRRALTYGQYPPALQVSSSSRSSSLPQEETLPLSINSRSSILSPQSGDLLRRLLTEAGYDPKLWDQLKAKPFYNILLRDHIPKIMRKFKDPPWKKIWTNVWKMEGLTRSERQFLYLQFHQILPTLHDQDHTSRRSLDPDDGLCIFCGAFTENNDHIFSRCSTLDKFRRNIFSFVQRNPVMEAVIGDYDALEFYKFLYMVYIDITDRQFQTIFMYSFAYKLSIWKARSSVNNGAPVPNYQRLVDLFNGLLRPITYVE